MFAFGKRDRVRVVVREGSKDGLVFVDVKILVYCECLLSVDYLVDGLVNLAIRMRNVVRFDYE